MQDSFRIESTPSFPVWLPRALPPIELLRSIKHCSRPGFSMTSLMEHTEAQTTEHRYLLKNFDVVKRVDKNKTYI